MRKLFQALADKEFPKAKTELRSAWRGVAFANYVGEWTLDPGNRPSWEQWRQSNVAFRAFLERVKPSRVLVCGPPPLEEPSSPRQAGGKRWQELAALSSQGRQRSGLPPHPASGRDLPSDRMNEVRDAVAELRAASQLTREDRIELAKWKKRAEQAPGGSEAGVKAGDGPSGLALSHASIAGLASPRAGTLAFALAANSKCLASVHKRPKRALGTSHSESLIGCVDDAGIIA